MTNETLSERFAELFERYHRNSCYPFAEPFEAKAFADEAMAILAERPTPSPDATEAARAMRGDEEKQWEPPTLNPCRCGQRAEIDEFMRSDSSDCVRIRCVACGRMSSERFYSEEAIDELAAAWNALPLPTPQPDERDKALRVAKEALERLDKLTPNAANAATAHDLHLTVRAIAATALATIAAAKSKGGEK